MPGAGRRLIHHIERWPDLMTQVQAGVQLFPSLLFQARIDPLWQRYLAQNLLHLGDTLAV